jgi:hypothetical protein
MSDRSVTVVPLVPNLALPRPASPRTRADVPQGYGVQEHCLPFVGASSMGFLIPSPISFGLCLPEEAPKGCRTFRSPIGHAKGEENSEPQVFYIFDNPDCCFSGNAYQLEGIPAKESAPILEPGISFFERPDQQHLFKLHLPYVWRTQEAFDTLFLPLLNRSAKGLEIQSGLVETDWYPSPVNLIIAKPPGSVHILKGELLAHAIVVPRRLRRLTLEVAPLLSRLNRETRKGLAEWDKQRNKDRSAYKTLARERHDRIEET